MSSSPLRIIRVCPEHMCRIFEAEKLMERTESGELRLHSKIKPKTKPFWDFKGQLCVQNEESLILNDNFPVDDPRHEVARIHRHVTESGTYGASGLPDPKDIVIGNVNYRGIGDRECELCKSGDMIPPEQRFVNSKYRPGATIKT